MSRLPSGTLSLRPHLVSTFLPKKWPIAGQVTENRQLYVP